MYSHQVYTLRRVIFKGLSLQRTVEQRQFEKKKKEKRRERNIIEALYRPI